MWTVDVIYKWSLTHLAALGVFGVHAPEVHLGDEVDVAALLCSGGGRVGPHDEFAIDLEWTPISDVNILLDFSPLYIHSQR